jgi:hypothetical protein
MLNNFTVINWRDLQAYILLTISHLRAWTYFTVRLLRTRRILEFVIYLTRLFRHSENPSVEALLARERRSIKIFPIQH